MHSTTIAVDIAKSVFEIAVSRHPGTVSKRHRVPRARFLEFFAERQPATVVLEACGTAHHWARRLRTLGHLPILVPPHAVRPYDDPRKRNPPAAALQADGASVQIDARESR